MRILTALAMLVISSTSYASSSSITQAEGEACMGRDKSRSQTEEVALESAKRLAADYSSTHITSSTVVENFQLKEDIVKAFNEAEVKVLEILEKAWEEAPGDCYTIKIRAEVIPAPAPIQAVDATQWMANPTLPLNVRLWVNQQDRTYEASQEMKVYLQGNKPFYARLIYVDAQGNNIPLLPNQHRRRNYFHGGTLFEVPTDDDRFKLTVRSPFGKEKLVLYASTERLGSIEKKAAGEDVYLVTETLEEVASGTRSIAVTAGPTGSGGNGESSSIAEFAEATVEITTSDKPPSQ